MKSRGFVFGLGTGARKSLVFFWSAVFLCSLMLQSVAAPAFAVHDEGLFELDGNVENSGRPGRRLERRVRRHERLAARRCSSRTRSTASNDKYFAGGATKDTTDITEWAWTTVSQPQDKNDISDAYAAAYKKDGDVIVYFGLDRYASNGAAQVGFWFLQSDFGLVNADGAAGTFTGEHVNGDVLVQIDFENGGASPVIRIYEWQNGLTLVSTGGLCGAAAGDNRCAIASTGLTNPDWQYNDKGEPGLNDDIPAGGMVEGGINLTALNLDDGCFTSFLAETRSSPSPESTLSDYAFGNFELCAKPDIETHVRQQGNGEVSVINKGDSVFDRAILTGDSGVVEGSVKFFVCRNPEADGKPDCSTGGDQVGGSDDLVDGKADSDVFTPTQLGYYCFRVEYTPAAGSKYLAAEHTNQTTECFQVIPAEIDLTKVADAGSVSAGQQIGFTLTITSKGPGSAFGVKVTDTLPTDGGLNWAIDAANTTGTWAINGGVLSFGGADGVTMPKDATFHVHIVSPTTAASCGEIDNTGDATTTNDGTDTASAT